MHVLPTIHPCALPHSTCQQTQSLSEKPPTLEVIEGSRINDCESSATGLWLVALHQFTITADTVTVLCSNIQVRQ